MAVTFPFLDNISSEGAARAREANEILHKTLLMTIDSGCCCDDRPWFKRLSGKAIASCGAASVAPLDPAVGLDSRSLEDALFHPLEDPAVVKPLVADAADNAVVVLERLPVVRVVRLPTDNHPRILGCVALSFRKFEKKST